VYGGVVIAVLALTVGGALFTMTGCGTSGDGAGWARTSPPSGARPAQVVPALTIDPHRVSIKQVSGQPTAGALHQLWSAVNPVETSRSVMLFYFASPPSRGCPSVFEARVTESQEWVHIQLVLKPGDPSIACPLVGIPTVTTIQLDNDLGSRLLLEPEGGR
jgi:hypothetical protein